MKYLLFILSISVCWANEPVKEFYTSAKQAPVKKCNPKNISSCFSSLSTAQHAFEIDHGHKTQYVALLLHGLSNSPYHLKDIAPIFYNNGMNVVAIRFSGHGTDPKHLEAVKLEEWLADVEYGINKALKKGSKIIVGGLSMGATFATYFALKRPDVIKGLVLLSPGIQFRPVLNIVTPVMCFLQDLGMFTYVGQKNFGKGVRYQKIATHSVCELHRFSKFFTRPITVVNKVITKTKQTSPPQESIIMDNFYNLNVPTYFALSGLDRAINIDTIFMMAEVKKGNSTIVYYSNEFKKASKKVKVINHKVKQLTHTSVYIKKDPNSFTTEGNPNFDIIESSLANFLQLELP